MAAVENPALKEFAVVMGNGIVLAQVFVRRADHGFELRHVTDRERDPETLRLAGPAEARAVAQFTAAGAFRPLKSAPNLQAGWRIVASDLVELEAALNQIYPGAMADWHAARAPKPPVTHFPEFTQRQSGMYRITAKLDDSQAEQVTRACCASSFCLKQRLWTAGALAPDPAADKSIIPCLEPCAILLEFARKAARIGQQEKARVELAPAEAATIRAALALALVRPKPAIREADFSAPQNPRRVQLLLEKLRPLSELADGPESESE